MFIFYCIIFGVCYNVYCLVAISLFATFALFCFNDYYITITTNTYCENTFNTVYD